MNPDTLFPTTLSGDILIEIGFTNGRGRVNVVDDNEYSKSFTKRYKRLFSSVKVKVILADLDNPNTQVLEQTYAYYQGLDGFKDWLLNKIKVAGEQFKFICAANTSIDTTGIEELISSYLDEEISRLEAKDE